jgi:hypothetical protein
VPKNAYGRPIGTPADGSNLCNPAERAEPALTAVSSAHPDELERKVVIEDVLTALEQRHVVIDICVYPVRQVDRRYFVRVHECPEL